MPIKRRYMHPNSGLVVKADDTTYDVSKMLDNSSDPNNIFYSLTYAHGAAHRDTIINATHYVSSGNTSVLYLLTTGSPLQLHMIYQVQFGGIGRARFYEAPTVTGAGSAITIQRCFRPSEKTTQAQITSGGSVSDYGTLIKDQYSGGTWNAGSSALHDDAEWVLKVDTTYALFVERTATFPVSVEFEWYEVPEL